MLMKNIPPSINSLTFTGSAVVIGFILIDDLTINEQNAVGDWLMLVGQVLQTNASQQQVLEDRQTDCTKGSNDIDLIKKSINCINKEIEKLKKE